MSFNKSEVSKVYTVKILLTEQHNPDLPDETKVDENIW